MKTQTQTHDKSARPSTPIGEPTAAQGASGGPTTARTLRVVRAMLLAVFVFGVVGAGTELILLEHMEDALQWIPLILMVLGLITVAWCVWRPTRPGIRVMQGLMALYVVSGFVGLFLHYRGNVEFELEMYPSMAGLELFWESIRGATPTLSPGTMVVLGLIGWVYTFRHPGTVQQDRTDDANTGAIE